MSNRFEAYARSPRGQQLKTIITAPDRYTEYCAFSREGLPAVAALVSLLKPRLEPLRRTSPREFEAAKQFCGWLAGKIMRDHGHEIVRRSRVRGQLFTVGSVWNGESACCD